MGNTTSTSAGQCLLSAVGGNPALVAFQNAPLYQAVDVRPYNLDVPVTPVAVTTPETVDQVAAIVKCAADAGYKVQPKSGGHSYGNYGLGGVDGEVVVDLKNFQQFSMNNETWRATIGAGTLLGDVTTRLYNAGGRAMAHGTCPQVGIGGHATIGGLGPTSRLWGAALDHIEEVQVVLTNSSIVRASQTENPDLLFALKGAGASFGIITEFTVRTEPAPGEAVQYSYTFNFGDNASKAKTFKDWQAFVSTPNLNRKFAATMTVLEDAIVASGTFFGTKEEFDAFELESHFPENQGSNVTVVQDWLGLVADWAEDAALEGGGGVPSAFYAKSLNFSPDTLIPNDTIDDMFDYFSTTEKDALLWFAIFDLSGGAVSDVPVHSTSYTHRDTLFWLQSYAISVGPVSNTTIQFLDGLSNLLTSSQPEVHFGAYPGYVDPKLPDGQLAYWGSNLPKLEQIKAEVDPNDVFHNPQSVKPAKQ
ncbi:CAZyme family AA7 [Paecilomyces variotii]|nr:CAZyme family AA7 [Paecilomyces variotii]